MNISDLRAGREIEIPAQMSDAVRLSGGVPSLSVPLCDYVPFTRHYLQNCWSHLLSNIEISKKKILVWGEYCVGPERLISNGRPSIVVQRNPAITIPDISNDIPSIYPRQKLQCGREP